MKKLLTLFIAICLTFWFTGVPTTGTTLIFNSFRFAAPLDHVADTAARLSIDPTGKVAGYRVIQDDGPTTYEFLGAGADTDAGIWVTLAGTTSWNGVYTFNGVDRYELIADAGATRSDFTIDRWTFGGDYINQTVSTYAWSQNWTAIAGDLPAPTVARNPIASEANWTIIP